MFSERSPSPALSERDPFPVPERWRVVAMRPPLGFLLACLCAMTFLALDVVPAPMRADYTMAHLSLATGAGNNTLYFGRNQDAVPPTAPRHFGLHFDRGLPIAEIPMGRAQLVLGAPPKIYRTMLVLPDVSLVWANFQPDWLPRELYGQWWFTEDWRAMRWADHLEITNGIEFIECTPNVSGTPAEVLGSAYWCPEQPDLKIVHEGAAHFLVVYYPNGARSTFEKDTGASTTSEEGRYAMVEMARKATSGGDADGYVRLRVITRKFINRTGNIGSISFPDKRPLRIDVWKPGPGSSGGAMIAARTLLQYRDLNAPSRDCNAGGSSVEPQCSGSSNKCYDEKCSAERQENLAQECFSAYCSFPYLGLGVDEAECQQAMCSTDPNPTGCWDDICNRPVMGDPKLWRIIMPQSVAPPASRPLVYTLHYNVSSLNDGDYSNTFLGEKEPRLKFLDHLEDNRVIVGADANFIAPRKHHGNAMQFGYDRLSLPIDNLFLKSWSDEAGYDIRTAKFEFQDYGLIQRVWTTRQNPYTILYSTPPAVTQQVQFRDPFGLTVQKTYAPIGTIPATPCDPAVGCNTQWGVTRIVTPEGATSSYEYSEADDFSKGKLKKIIAADGSITEYTLDAAGKATQVTKGSTADPTCMTETYGFDANSAFPNTPRSSTSTTAGQTSTSTFTLCEGASCPGFELGAVLSTEVQLPAPGHRMTETTSHTNGNGGVTSLTTVSDGNSGPHAVMKLIDREAVLGLPATSITPDARTNTGRAALATAANNPATGDPSAGAQSANCNADEEFCGGAQGVQNSHTDTPRPYPVVLTGKPLEAAKELNLDVFEEASITTRSGSTTEHGSQPSASADGTAPPGPVEYDIEGGTGMPIRSTTTKMGITLRTQTDWMKVDTAFNSTRNHPTATLAERAWSKTGTDPELFLNGAWNAFSKAQFAATFPNAGFTFPTGDEPDNTYATHLGPVASGHFRADGETPAFPDSIMTQDPRRQDYSVVGCADYKAQGASCGGLYGFICRQNYIRDPKITADRNNLSPTLYNSDWWLNNCKIPMCPGSFSTLYCRNPKPL